MPDKIFYVPETFERILKLFDEICEREGSSRSDKLRAFIARFVAVHEPGNPQLLLETFIGDVQGKCYRCEGMFPALTPVEFISGLRAGLCGTCLEREQAKGPFCVIKRVLKPKRKRLKRGT